MLQLQETPLLVGRERPLTAEVRDLVETRSATREASDAQLYAAQLERWMQPDAKEVPHGRHSAGHKSGAP